MKRLTIVTLCLGLMAFALPGIADNHSMGAKAAPKTVTGELVDMGCYLAHAAHGEKHISCASKCLSQGMPMGVLTTSGMLYLVTLDHDTADPYNSLKDLAGQQVSVTGNLLTRNGMKAIEASAVTLAAK